MCVPAHGVVSVDLLVRPLQWLAQCDGGGAGVPMCGVGGGGGGGGAECEGGGSME